VDSEIDPISRCRLPLVERESLNSEAATLYDALVRGDRNIRGLHGPGGILLHSPDLLKLFRPVGRFLRFEAGLEPRVREVAILITARCCESQFEWAAHEKEALKEGVPRETIDAIRLGQPVEGLDTVDAAIIELGRETFLARKVSSETYRKVFRMFGDRGLVNLAALMGNYASTAALLTIFDMQLDEGLEPLLPKL
jgi:4-carboxymuconolactone decarboxylase